jgi:hypothetical protein
MIDNLRLARSNHGSEQSAPPNPIHDASPAAEISPTGPPAEPPLGANPVDYLRYC